MTRFQLTNQLKLDDTQHIRVNISIVTELILSNYNVSNEQITFIYFITFLTGLIS